MGFIPRPQTTLPQTPATTETSAPQNGVSELWQVFTFVFAGLWVITSIITVMVWKKRPHESKNKEINSQTQLNVDGLKAVIKQGDAAKIERAINEYLEAHRESLNSEVVEAVKHDLEVMNQARFSAEQQPWSADSLLDNINKLSKAKKTQSSPQLEKL